MKQYYILKDNKNVGPMLPGQLVQYGLEPNSLVWTEGMPQWLPANQITELLPYLSPVTSTPPAAPTPPPAPAHQQAYQQPYQQPYQQNPLYYAPVQQPFNNITTQGIFKILLYLVMVYTAVSGLIGFIKSFDLIKGNTWSGVFMLFSSMSVIFISVVIVIRMAKKENYGFFALTFFLLAFLFSLLNMIIINTHYLFILMLVASILGFIFTLFAVIPLEKLGDTESFNAILAEAKPVDFVLLGIYIAFSAAFLIYVAVAGRSISAFK